MKLQITIDGAPVPQCRPRFRRFGKFVSTYDPMSKEKELKAMVVKNDLGKGFKIIETGMQVEILFGMPIPKSLKNVSAGDPHLKRPDIDNLTKYVMDMLNGVVYKDDSQIYTLTVNKMYSKRPLTEIFIYY